MAWLSDFTCHLQCFGCELWLWFSVIHARDPFWAFAHWQPNWAVLFHWNLSRHPFFGLVKVVDLDLLLCKGFNLEHEVSMHLFTQKLMKDLKIEWRDEHSLVWNMLLQIWNPLTFHFSRIKSLKHHWKPPKIRTCPRMLQAKCFWVKSHHDANMSYLDNLFKLTTNLNQLQPSEK